MKYFITFLLAALSLNAIAQTNPNYNPDYDANGVIGVDDILGILSTFGDTWDSGDLILGCTYPAAVEYNSSANVDDGSCTFPVDCAGVLNGTSVIDECGVCGGSGIADGDCDCNGNVLDECGVCGGDGIADGDCDCEGNQFDAIGVCGGECEADANGNNICDSLESSCELPQEWNGNTGCNMTCLVNHEFFENFPPLSDDAYLVARLESGLVVGSMSVNVEGTYLSIWGNNNGTSNVDGALSGEEVHLQLVNGNFGPLCCLYEISTSVINYYCNYFIVLSSSTLTPCSCVDIDLDLVCDDVDDCVGALDECGVCGGDGSSCAGCTDVASCNWDPAATIDDGSCYYSCFGCTDPGACNFDPGASFDDGSCDNWSCWVDCLDPLACNYDPTGLYDDGGFLCDYSCFGCDGVANSGLVNDECGVCGGDGSSCAEPEFSECGDDITHDNYDYSTVQIGDQCWFSENCRYLPVVSSSSAGSETSPYYYVYGYQGSTVSEAQATENYTTYGVLYNWPAVMTEGICPSGWHIPTDEEWQTMEISLGMSGEASASAGWRGSPVGDYLKSTSGWNDGGNGSNSSGFNGLPGGYRSGNNFDDGGNKGYWWSASESDGYSWERGLYFNYDSVYRGMNGNSSGYSARCVRD
jgi:uncharacterized protein (TIGR02145 family)